MATDIDQQIRMLIADILDIDPGRVRPEMHFINDFGANSLDIVELIMRLEETFHLEIPDELAEDIATVGDVIAYAQSVLKGAPVAPPPGADLAVPDTVEDAVTLRSLPPAAHPRVDTLVAIACDHAGLSLKEALKASLHDQGYSVRDLGPSDAASVDYPDYALAVAAEVSRGACRFGVLVCGSGIGMAIAANKVQGVRATTVHTELEARLSRQHNDANVVCFGARLLGEAQVIACLEAFLEARFDPGDDQRHRRRINRIAQIGAERLGS